MSKFTGKEASILKSVYKNEFITLLSKKMGCNVKQGLIFYTGFTELLKEQLLEGNKLYLFLNDGYSLRLHMTDDDGELYNTPEYLAVKFNTEISFKRIFMPVEDGWEVVEESRKSQSDSNEYKKQP